MCIRDSPYTEDELGEKKKHRRNGAYLVAEIQFELGEARRYGKEHFTLGGSPELAGLDAQDITDGLSLVGRDDQQEVSLGQVHGLGH